MTKKLTSYQKLQEKIKRLEEQKKELILVIVEDDYHSMQQVKGLYDMNKSIEKALFFGDATI